MKKLSMGMAVVMLFVSCFVFTASAEGNGIKVAVAIPEEVTAGAEFTVNVNFSENDGFNTLGVKLTYPEGFTYVADSAAASALIEDECYLDFAGFEGETYVFYHDATARTLTFVGASLYDIDEASGSLFSAKFTAPEEESTGNQFAVEVVDTAYNATGETVTLTPENGSTDVVEMAYALGDVNMDEEIDLFDAMAVLRYEAEIAEFTETQKVLADVNKDDEIDLFDAMMILRYEADLIESFN